MTERVCQPAKATCHKPARYRVIPIPNGKDVERFVCYRHARQYDKKWLEKIAPGKMKL